PAAPGAYSRYQDRLPGHVGPRRAAAWRIRAGRVRELADRHNGAGTDHARSLRRVLRSREQGVRARLQGRSIGAAAVFRLRDGSDLLPSGMDLTTTARSTNRSIT